MIEAILIIQVIVEEPPIFRTYELNDTLVIESHRQEDMQYLDVNGRLITYTITEY